ncbi:MAG: zinc ribbon domain-containing protein [Ruminococcaceae bacterium]|nr:zinc ribbon domain-containing protein [Oscillospiraceae bacterium]
MAECPKCKKHLKLTDWKPNCPHCGANIVVYDLQERLMQEADIAEVQYYHFQKKVDRLKTSFVGSKLTIIRIFTSLIPIVALFLPIVKIKLAAPFEPYDGNMGILDIYNMFDKLNPSVFVSFMSEPSTKTAGILFTVSIVLLLLSVVLMLVHFLCNMIALAPKGKIRNYSLDIAYIVSVIAAMVCFSVIPENGSVGGVLGIGAYIYFALVILNFVVDILCFRENLQVKHSQCYVGGIPIEEYFSMVERGDSPEQLRKEMYKRLTEIQEEQERKLREKTAKKEAELNG